MSENATVTIKSLDHKETGWYELRDGNDTVYSTKKEEIIMPALALIGKQAVLTFVVKTNSNGGRTYTNRWLEKVEGAAAPSGDVPFGTGEYVTGQKPAIEVRRIAAAVAWNNAARLAPLVAGISAETVFGKTKALADDIYLDLLQKGQVLEDSEIPF